MHKRVVFNFGKFKSRKCSISFSRDYACQGQKNKKALKIKAFRGYIFFIALIWLRDGIFHCPPQAHSRLPRLVASSRHTPCFVRSRGAKTILNRFGLLPHSLRRRKRLAEVIRQFKIRTP